MHNKQKIQTLIPKAIKAIEQAGIAKSNEVEKVFKGYFAEFGASVVQAGLLPAVIFFGDANSNTEGDRHLLTHAILILLKGEAFAKDTSLKKYLLLNVLERKEADFDRARKEILECAIALKLALRTFKIK